MSQRTVLLLGILALLVTGGIVWGSRHEPEAPGGFALEGEGTPSAAAADPRAAGGPEAAPIDTPSVPRGLPRILPPEAAIEDVRDALALPADTRAAALQEAHAALGRIARNDRILVVLQRTVAQEEDPRVRGVVLAALGMHRSGVNLAWLANRLATGPAAEDHLGALLALAFDAEGDVLQVPSLGGLRARHGALPVRGDVREGLRHVLSSLDSKAWVDALPMLRRAVRESEYADLASALEAWSERAK